MMGQIFFIIAGLLFIFWSPSVWGQSNFLKLTIEGKDGTILRGSTRGDGVLLNFPEVDGLGISLNPHGRVNFLPRISGAVYEATVDVTTEIPAGVASVGELSVTRSRSISPKDLPKNALYDADRSASFSNLLNANQLDDLIPVIIDRDVPTGKRTLTRKVGVFISTDLPAGFYEANVIYTLIAQ